MTLTFETYFGDLNISHFWAISGYACIVNYLMVYEDLLLSLIFIKCHIVGEPSREMG